MVIQLIVSKLLCSCSDFLCICFFCRHLSCTSSCCLWSLWSWYVQRNLLANNQTQLLSLWLSVVLEIPYYINSHGWVKNNFSIQYKNNIKQISSDENKEKDQLGDSCWCNTNSPNKTHKNCIADSKEKILI